MSAEISIPPGMVCSACFAAVTDGHTEHWVAGYRVIVCNACIDASNEHQCGAPEVVPVHAFGIPAPVGYICARCTWKRETEAGRLAREAKAATEFDASFHNRET